jgi:hypothetical protein
MNSVASEKFIAGLTFKNFLNIRLLLLLLLLLLPPQATSLTSSRIGKGRRGQCEVHNAHVRIITSVSLQSTFKLTGIEPRNQIICSTVVISGDQAGCCFSCPYVFLATDLKLWRVNFI